MRCAPPRLTALLIAAFALAEPGATARQAPTASRAAQDPVSGMIVGQVVDGNGAPVPEASVVLMFNGPRPEIRVIADRQGRYFFADLSAGDYSLGASKAGYTEGWVGQRRPGGPASPLNLKPGERRVDTTLTLWKFAVISGTVLDEAGEPVVGIGVRALMRTVVAGRLSFGNREVPPDRLPTAVTDDRGQFRISRLLPGSYVVLVPVTLTTLPAATLGETIRARSGLFSSGILDLADRGQARTVQIGDVALINMTRVVTPPPPTAGGAMRTYRATYYVASPTGVEATPVAVASGEERSGIVITMRPTPAVRISGRLVTPDGTPPPPMTLRLFGASADGIVDSNLSSGVGPPIALYDTAVGRSDASGRFTLAGVPPGDYMLRHGERFLTNLAAGGAYWIAQRITVGTSNLNDVVVTARPAFRVEGRIEVRESVDLAALPPFLARGVVVFRQSNGQDNTQFVAQALDASAPGTFMAPAAAGGRYVAQPSESGGFFVDAVALDSKDITDRAFDLQSDVTTLVVTYTNRPSRVSGMVRDARRTTRPDAIVVVFPVDDTRWADYGEESRRVRSATLSESGEFAFSHLPPGDYFIAALEGEDPHAWKDPAHLHALASQATRMTVTPHTPRTINLVSTRAPQ